MPYIILYTDIKTDTRTKLIFLISFLFLFSKRWAVSLQSGRFKFQLSKQTSIYIYIYTYFLVIKYNALVLFSMYSIHFHCMTLLTPSQLEFTRFQTKILLNSNCTSVQVYVIIMVYRNKIVCCIYIIKTLICTNCSRKKSAQKYFFLTTRYWTTYNVFISLYLYFIFVYIIVYAYYRLPIYYYIYVCVCL